MKKSPYSHEQVPGSPRQYQARHNNVLNILSSLVKNPQEQVAQRPPIPPPMIGTLPPSPGGAPQAMPEAAPQPWGDMPAQQYEPPVDTDSIVSGVPEDFQAPPIKGYWLQRLEENVRNDPSKKGPDWRDEAIMRFRRVRERLDRMEEELNRRQAGR